MIPSRVGVIDLTNVDIRSSLPPLQGGSAMGVFLGLKLQAESCYPFGIRLVADPGWYDRLIGQA